MVLLVIITGRKLILEVPLWELIICRTIVCFFLLAFIVGILYYRNISREISNNIKFVVKKVDDLEVYYRSLSDDEKVRLLIKYSKDIEALRQENEKQNPLKTPFVDLAHLSLNPSKIINHLNGRRREFVDGFINILTFSTTEENKEKDIKIIEYINDNVKTNDAQETKIVNFNSSVTNNGGTLTGNIHSVK